MEKLNDIEKRYIMPNVIALLNTCTHIECAITSNRIIEILEPRIKAAHPDYKFNGAAVRAIINQIRHDHSTKYPLLASGSGYYCSSDFKTIQKYLKGLRGRALEILNVAESIDKWSNDCIEKKQLTLF